MTSPAEEQVNALLERIEPHILLLICGEKVMLDDDLALLYYYCVIKIMHIETVHMSDSRKDHAREYALAGYGE